MTGSAKPFHVHVFTQVHINACYFLIDAPIYKCFTGSILWSFCINYANLVKLHTTITNLQHFKHLKVGKNLHANMEGFHRGGHKCTFINIEIRGTINTLSLLLYCIGGITMGTKGAMALKTLQ